MDLSPGYIYIYMYGYITRIYVYIYETRIYNQKSSHNSLVFLFLASMGSSQLYDEGISCILVNFPKFSKDQLYESGQGCDG